MNGALIISWLWYIEHKLFLQQVHKHIQHRTDALACLNLHPFFCDASNAYINNIAQTESSVAFQYFQQHLHPEIDWATVHTVTWQKKYWQNTLADANIEYCREQPLLHNSQLLLASHRLLNQTKVEQDVIFLPYLHVNSTLDYTHLIKSAYEKLAVDGVLVMSHVNPLSPNHYFNNLNFGTAKPLLPCNTSLLISSLQHLLMTLNCTQVYANFHTYYTPISDIFHVKFGEKHQDNTAINTIDMSKATVLKLNQIIQRIQKAHAIGNRWFARFSTFYDVIAKKHAHPIDFNQGHPSHNMHAFPKMAICSKDTACI